MGRFRIKGKSTIFSKGRFASFLLFCCILSLIHMCCSPMISRCIKKLANGSFICTSSSPSWLCHCLESIFFKLYGCYPLQKWDNLLLTALAYRKEGRRTLPTYATVFLIQCFCRPSSRHSLLGWRGRVMCVNGAFPSGLGNRRERTPSTSKSRLSDHIFLLPEKLYEGRSGEE